MIRNYLKIALRNLLKHKFFSLINITGLAIGIAAFLLILQYVKFERSYDKFHKAGDRIYRLQQDRYNNGALSTQWAAGAAGIGKAMQDNFPEVEAMTKLRATEGVISYNNNRFNENKIYYATGDFLPMFSYKVLAGSPASALSEPFSAVITESAAKKYFGTGEALGKVISCNKEEDFKITAVVADMPENTHLKFDMLFSFASLLQDTSRAAQIETTFDWDGFYTYVKLRPGTDPRALEKKISTLLDQKIGRELKERNEGLAYKLQPLYDIHLYSAYMYEAEANGSGQSVYFLFIIAFFIIIIAWINYINLSTARAAGRAKEVGIRKAIGSHRLQLMAQFMFEAFLINLFAVLLALVLVLVTLPLFNSLTGRHLGFSLLGDAAFWLALAGIFAVGTLLAGLYPAFIMSAFKPASVLKGRFTGSRKGAFLRQALVITQFAASVILMVGTFGVYRQLSFMRSQDLGVNIDRTLVLKGPHVIDTATYKAHLKTFKAELLSIPGVDKAVGSTAVPGRKVGWNAGGIKLIGSGPGASNQYRAIGIDYGFIDAYGLKLIAGRNFSEQLKTDRNTVLFNQAALKLIGFNKPSDILNKRIDFWGEEYTVIGVVSNHHQESLKSDYDAHIYRLTPNTSNYISLKMQAKADPKDIIRAAEKQWNSLFPGNPFDYFYLNERFEEQYNADRQFGKAFGLFAVLAIFVACLGLLGLASFVTTQRTREIGIRKISGASVSTLLLLLTKDFIKPVLVALVIALPATYYLLSRWLQDYAFRVSLGPWLFVLPGLLVLVIAIVTISTQTIKAASANPVKSLRTD